MALSDARCLAHVAGPRVGRRSAVQIPGRSMRSPLGRLAHAVRLVFNRPRDDGVRGTGADTSSSPYCMG